MFLIGRSHLADFTRRVPATRTALAMWWAIAEDAHWRDESEARACFPNVQFLTPKLVRFHLTGVKCVITAQIAFNIGVLIVLAVSEAHQSHAQEF
jgi:mRNA-degrading endonuclease HigB of HigAB toxin-antitoxin module